MISDQHTVLGACSVHRNGCVYVCGAAGSPVAVLVYSFISALGSVFFLALVSPSRSQTDAVLSIV